MKNKDIIPLINGIIKLAEIKGTKFQYCLIKNRKKLLEEHKTIIESLEKVPESFKDVEEKYIKERDDLLNKYCEKDKSGNIIKAANGQMTINKPDQFLKDEKKLKEKYPEYITELDKIDKKNEVLLNTDCNV
ncbi:hypothetical protein LCGC14_3069570, partial [marine sediment metagenome]